MTIEGPSGAFSDTAFRGRVYGVTGSAHGIGEATVRALCGLGARVVLVDFDAENLKRVGASLRETGAEHLCIRGNVGNKATIVRAIAQAQKRWGRIDGWVSNAMYNPVTSPEETRDADVRRSLAVNFEAAWNTIALLTPILRKRGGGSIVNIGSIQARRSLPGNSVYAACKAALEGMTHGLAQDLAPDRIRVNLVVPGAINTGRSYSPLDKSPELIAGVPKSVVKKCMELEQKLWESNWKIYQRWPSFGQPHEVTPAILFLLSDAACFITGASLPVDGGASAFGPNREYIGGADIPATRAALRKLVARYPSLARSKRASTRPRRK